MWERITVPIGITQSLDTIFSAVLLGAIDKKTKEGKEIAHKKENINKVCRTKFLGEFPNNIFNNNYALFYEIIVTFNISTFTLEQIDSIIENNRDLILNSPYIDKSVYTNTTSGTVPTDDDIIMAISADLKDKFKELSYNVVSESEFESACNIYIDWYKNTFMWYTANNMAAIMSDTGLEIREPGKRVRKYQGFDDATEYYNKNLRIIKSLTDESRIRSFVVDETWLENDSMKDKAGDDKSMFNIGIKEIDDSLGPLRRGHLLGVLGPPKGGKTRFSNFLVQRALRNGFNVAVWPLEGTSEEWIAMQTSCFIATSTYEECKKTGQGNIVRIPSKEVLNRRFKPKDDIGKVISGAKVTMATSPEFGRLSFIEGTAYVENFLDVLESHYNNENPFDVIVIDSLVNIMSNTGRGKVERISQAYMEMKNFVANRLKVPALAIVPAQLKQDVVDFIRRNPDETLDVTAGGESAETIRTPDEVIGLFSSKEERDSNQMKMYSVASRHSGDFPDFTARCYLESCLFLSEDDDIRNVQ